MGPHLDSTYARRAMLLAGVRISEPFVLDLADRLRDDGFDAAAQTLNAAQASRRAVVALTVRDREMILRVLGDPPEGLAELRGVLLREHVWRVRVGLVLGVCAGGVLRRGKFAP